MKNKVAFILLLIYVSFSLKAQNPYKGEVNIDIVPCELLSDRVNLQFNIDLSRLFLNHNDMIIFTPKLVSINEQHEITFEPVIISGKRRSKILNREAAFGKMAHDIHSENFHIITHKDSLRSISLEYTVVFEKWMRHSRLVIKEQTYGCYRCRNSRLYADGHNAKFYEGEPFVFPEPYQPVYKVIYMTPPVEDIKILSDTYSAQLQFPVNRVDLIESFGKNKDVLAEVDQIINRIRTDSLLTIRRIFVQGYASPEGSASVNLHLSQGRAQSFMTYLHWKHNFYEADRLISSNGMGEDWEGLKKWIVDSDFRDKASVLEVIDNNPNPERRKSAIKKLSGGATYRFLLENAYPSLRRNEYRIEYEVRGFNVQEAQQLIGSRPQLLSLNEMFMVANLYNHGSKEFSEVFDIAIKVYPKSPIAQLNVAASEIERGIYDMAIPRLSEIETPQAWNNLAIAYWHIGQENKALELFEKAVGLGSIEARFNLEEFRKWDDDRDK